MTIGGTAFVKGSVYGGSENGHVRHDTHVNIQDDCQIGCGKNTTNRHEVDNPDVWKSTYVPTDDNNLECYSWPYEEPFAPFDPNALTTGKYDYIEYNASGDIVSETHFDLQEDGGNSRLDIIYYFRD